jgi:hypothetical protein
MFDSLDDCDDMWTQLAAKMIGSSYGEVWYWGGKRKTVYNEHMRERWINSFSETRYDFSPEVIFARGGFSEYDQVLLRNKKSFKIYYGAGMRFTPQSYKNFDMILVDSEMQLSKARRLFGKRAKLWIKPAADNIFKPYVSSDKPYDAIYVANEHKLGIKGHDFVFSSIGDHKILHVGLASNRLRMSYANKNIDFVGWVPRKDLPILYSKSKLSIIACTERDSCPRVIPESLACNCPILSLDSVQFWSDKYITPATGVVTNKEHFISDLVKMISSSDRYMARQHYDDHVSLDVVSANMIREVMA